jgi:hypothetical protein
MGFRPRKPWSIHRKESLWFVETMQERNGMRMTAFLLSSPSMTRRTRMDREDWQAVADACVSRDSLLICDAALERLLFDDLPVVRRVPFPWNGRGNHHCRKRIDRATSDRTARRLDSQIGLDHAQHMASMNAKYCGTCYDCVESGSAGLDCNASLATAFGQ